MPSHFETKIHRQATAALRAAISGHTPLPDEVLFHLQSCQACQRKIEDKIHNNPQTIYGPTIEATMAKVIKPE